MLALIELRNLNSHIMGYRILNQYVCSLQMNHYTLHTQEYSIKILDTG